MILQVLRDDQFFIDVYITFKFQRAARDLINSKQIAKVSFFLKRPVTHKFDSIAIYDNILHFPANIPYHYILYWLTGRKNYDLYTF